MIDVLHGSATIRCHRPSATVISPFTASLYHPRGADNPDGYDFREALLQRGITVGVYGKDSLTVQDPVCFSFAGFIASLRHRLSASLIAALGGETGAYASAMLLGMSSLIPSDDRQAFSRLGIAHILSVSGFHVGVLINYDTDVFQPVIRASLLMLLGLEGRILNRPRSGLHLLSAVLFIMVLFSPVQVTSASFQLTFCAVFGLVWVMPFIRRRKRFRSRILQYVFESLVLTFGIQLGLLLPELSFFQRLPLLVFLVNLPAMLISLACAAVSPCSLPVSASVCPPFVCHGLPAFRYQAAGSIARPDAVDPRTESPYRFRRRPSFPRFLLLYPFPCRNAYRYAGPWCCAGCRVAFSRTS